jgi:phosphatidylserine/phosphatidylglycerophosphate/cardiolipin synthase-like enzyme
LHQNAGNLGVSNMSNFDIGTLLEYKPPRYQCEKCRALLYGLTRKPNENYLYCPICGVKYLPTSEYSISDIEKYLDESDCEIKLENPIDQGQKLAAIAHNFILNKSYYPPMRALLEAMSVAKSFIHFTSFGLSYTLFGALKLKAQSIPIRGIASNINPNFAKIINDYKMEAPKLSLRIFEEKPGQDWDQIPHQKLVVIDGILAFKGASNMTDSGWRKAARGRDLVEIVTNIKQVVELHNHLFSPIWAEKYDLKEINMENFPF